MHGRVVHGRFLGKHPHWPIIDGILYHSSIKDLKVSYEFMVDTGADRTLIVPDHQEILGIRDEELIPIEKPIHTFAGQLQLKCLRECSLVLNDTHNNAVYINDFTVFFIAKKSKWKLFPKDDRPLSDKRIFFPSIIGRDLLSEMSLGYSESSEYLFVTRDTINYFSTLHSSFPKPPEPDSMTWNH
jgi:hypothetical protein